MKVQAKNISDEVMLSALASVRLAHGVSILWDVQAALPQFPPKVVLAKLRSMIKRRILDGCDCGCRGDFELRRSKERPIS